MLLLQEMPSNCTIVTPAMNAMMPEPKTVITGSTAILQGFLIVLPEVVKVMNKRSAQTGNVSTKIYVSGVVGMKPQNLHELNPVGNQRIVTYIRM